MTLDIPIPLCCIHLRGAVPRVGFGRKVLGLYRVRRGKASLFCYSCTWSAPASRVFY